jgi:hypothetical protein
MLLRRHPFAATIVLVLLAGAVFARPAIVDAVTGSPPGDADLERPIAYIVFAPFSNTLDALTFLSIERVPWALGGWAVFLVAWGALRSGSARRRVARAAGGLVALIAVVGATAVLPRPVPRLVATSPALTVLDYHAHTAASHDGRKGWTAERLAAWHARQGFQASYVTDHNHPFAGGTAANVHLLPGAEWSVHRQHVLALGAPVELDRDRFLRSTPRMLRIFSELDRGGALTIAALPEFWRNHWDALDAFVSAGVGGFEVVDCAPKALGFPPAARRRVLDLARRNDLLVVGASDNHGWGAVTCVWNLAVAGAGGFRGNRVIARSLALSQGEGPVRAAALTQPWRLSRTLSWSERISWLTWIAVIVLYYAVPRRTGQTGGFAILARSLKLRALRRTAAPDEDGAPEGPHA